MQFIMCLPLAYHVWNVRTRKQRLLCDGLLSIAAFVLCIYASSLYLNAIVLMALLVLDVRNEYLLYIAMFLLMLLTWNASYPLVIWTLLELVFASHHRFLYKSYEDQMQEYQNKVFDRQVREVENMFMTMRGWRHDYHNHLQNLKAKLRNHQIEESIQYLDELEKELNEIRQIVESGNTNMDAILNSKLSLALRVNIELDVKAQVPEKLSISDTDVCALLGNMVDNAVEACEKVNGHKFIRLYIGKYKGQLYISCTNATNETVRKLDEEYITTKRGNHGHGLKRMNIIVEKYNGTINRRNEPGVFSTEILLPM